MKNPSKEDILCVIQEVIDNCEGAMMAAKGGSYLHNFAFEIGQKIRYLKDDIEKYDDSEE